jgi:hypothetical protein
LLIREKDDHVGAVWLGSWHIPFSFEQDDWCFVRFAADVWRRPYIGELTFNLYAALVDDVEAP